MAFAHVEKRTETGISLPAFICWLNCNCARERETQSNSFARIDVSTSRRFAKSKMLLRNFDDLRFAILKNSVKHVRAFRATGRKLGVALSLCASKLIILVSDVQGS